MHSYYTALHKQTQCLDIKSGEREPPLIQPGSLRENKLIILCDQCLSSHQQMP